MVVTLSELEARLVVKALQYASRWYMQAIDKRIARSSTWETTDLSERIEQFGALEDRIAGELGL